MKPSRKKWAAVLVGSATFTGFAILAIRDGDGWGWLGAVFFGLGVLVSLLFLGGGQSLILAPKGFTLQSLVAKRTYRWSDVERFYDAGVNQVGWDFRPTYKDHARVRRFNRLFDMPEAALGDTFGMSADDLAQVMNAWRNHYETSVSTDEY